ncbi:hypothetical protein Bca52824_016213 [Brassica carinata]|uniref:Uncharacterized protein n=1 Tax=Brassica carinata TaxID=52824 RepID=A0A8X7W5Z0_BRACI|nr:hypothetical protein Bca52824_016213 [Brassica carinata]
MAGNNDLKLKRPLEDVYVPTPEEAFGKAKLETQLHYRAMLAMQKEQLDAIILTNEAEGEVKAIRAKLELLDKLIPSYAMKSDKENLESELRLAEARMADMKVPVIDCFKLGEPNVYD